MLRQLRAVAGAAESAAAKQDLAPDGDEQVQQRAREVAAQEFSDSKCRGGTCAFRLACNLCLQTCLWLYGLPSK